MGRYSRASMVPENLALFKDSGAFYVAQDAAEGCVTDSPTKTQMQFCVPSRG